MKKVFGISALQVVVGTLLASLTFVLTYYVDIVSIITGQSSLSESVLRATLGEQIGAFTAIGTVNTIVIVLFWSVVGLVAYTAVWFMASAYVNARNEVKVEKEYTNRGQLKDRLRIPLIRVSIIIGLLIFLSLTLKVLWPYWLGLFGQFLLNVQFDTLGALGYLAGAYAGALLNLYVFKVGLASIRSLQ